MTLAGLAAVSAARLGGAVNTASAYVDLPAWNGGAGAYHVTVELLRKLPSVVVVGIDPVYARQVERHLSALRHNPPGLPRVRIVATVQHRGGPRPSGIAVEGWEKLAVTIAALARRAAGSVIGAAGGLGAAPGESADRLAAATRQADYLIDRVDTMWGWDEGDRADDAPGLIDELNAARSRLIDAARAVGRSMDQDVRTEIAAIDSAIRDVERWESE